MFRFQGSGRVVVTPHTDTIMLETDNGEFIVKVPGHTFSDGDEVDFEIAGEAVYLSKKTERLAGFTVNVLPKDELILQDNPDMDLLIHTLKSLLSGFNSGEAHSSLSIDLLKQIAAGVKGMISGSQQEQLEEIIALIIKKEKPDLPEIIKQLRTLIAGLGNATANKTPPLANVTRLVSFPELSISEGIYRFQNIASVQEFLGNSETGGLDKFLMEQFARDGCIWLRIANSGDGIPGVFQFSTAALKNELLSLIRSVSSDILSQIPVETFMDFTVANNGIDKQLLHLLPHQMSNVSRSPVMPDSISSTAYIQWLQTINGLRDYSEDLALRMPVRSTELFRGLLEIRETHGVLQGLSLNDIGIIPGTGKTPIALIENAIDGIGITFENKLSKGIIPSGSIKTELYRLLEAAHSTEQCLTSDGLQKNNRGVASAFDVRGSLTSIQSYLSQQISRLKDGNFPQNESLLKPVLKAGEVIDQLVTDSRNRADAMFSGISSETRGQYDVLVKETQTYPVNSSEPTWLQLLKNVASALPVLKRICTEVPAFHSLNTELENVMAELKEFLNQASAVRVDSALRDPEDLQKIIGSNLLSENTELTDLTVTAGENSIPRKVIEQLINRIESLQVLARQVVTPDGTSQILELPVKIGNEWTDVTLQIIKKEAPKKDGANAQKHFSICLDTAPSRLGGIHAVLDYEKGKNLSITMEFEQKEVASWFKVNQEKIRKSLQEGNIHFVSIHVKTVVDSDVNRGTEISSDRSTTFDIKA